MNMITSSGGSVREGGKWECPACLLVPKKEIYLCSNGHSVCCLCASKIKNCPICRVGIDGQIKQRNFALEHVLDSFKFECSWDGCDKVMARSDVAKHENSCSHNPNTVNLCRFMGNLYCTFLLTPESMQDVSKLDQVLEHIKSHGYQEKRIKLGDKEKSNFFLQCLRCPHSPTEYKRGNNFIKQIIRMDYESKKYIFLQVVRIYLDDAGQDVFSIIFVQLTPNFGQENFTFNLFIKRTVNMNAMIRWGTACMRTPTWGIKPMKVDEFIKYCEIPGEYSFPFPIRVSDLEKYHTDSNCQIQCVYILST